MPASLTILPHLPSWILIKSANSGGELENASKPTLPSVDLISGESMILRSSRMSRPTTSGDVCAGATIPAQESMSGALRALAVTRLHRSSLFPELPTPNTATSVIGLLG